MVKRPCQQGLHSANSTVKYPWNQGQLSSISDVRNTKIMPIIILSLHSFYTTPSILGLKVEGQLLLFMGVHLQPTPINYAPKFFICPWSAPAPNAPPGYAYEVNHRI